MEAPDEVPLVSPSDQSPSDARAKTLRLMPGERGQAAAGSRNVYRRLAFGSLGACAVACLVFTSAYLAGVLVAPDRATPPAARRRAAPWRGWIGIEPPKPPQGLPSQGPPTAECTAFDEVSCLNKPGCRWFFYTNEESDCPKCKEWFGKYHINVTGCRNWYPQYFCQEAIFREAQHKSGANPQEPWFVDAISHYGLTMGTGEAGNQHNKRMVCSVWCDFTAPNPCFGQPQMKTEIRGVNYGGRFVPEFFLGLPETSELLFKGVTKPDYADVVSLCDLNTSDAGDRMTKFLDTNIVKDHFGKMEQLGFNTVRIPLGYWNLIDIPGNDATPNTPPRLHDRLLNIQRLMPSKNYRKWIDRAFDYASSHGLKVILDLHSAPGGQSGNENTGCDLGSDEEFSFPTMPGTEGWNSRLGIQAIGVMAEICNVHGEACYGIELLNEPCGEIKRDALAAFYADAIKEARKHLDTAKPIILNEWPFWLFYWKVVHFPYTEFGRVVFSTHLYQFPDDPISDMQLARDQFTEHLAMVKDFFLDTPHQVIVTEYALNSHGSGRKDDSFDYNSLTNWFVHQFNQIAIGSLVWNFDSYYSAWGPACADKVGNSVVEWKRIFRIGKCHNGNCIENKTMMRL